MLHTDLISHGVVQTLKSMITDHWSLCMQSCTIPMEILQCLSWSACPEFPTLFQYRTAYIYNCTVTIETHFLSYLSRASRRTRLTRRTL